MDQMTVTQLMFRFSAAWAPDIEEFVAPSVCAQSWEFVIPRTDLVGKSIVNARSLGGYQDRNIPVQQLNLS